MRIILVSSNHVLMTRFLKYILKTIALGSGEIVWPTLVQSLILSTNVLPNKNDP